MAHLLYIRQQRSDHGVNKGEKLLVVDHFFFFFLVPVVPGDVYVGSTGDV